MSAIDPRMTALKLASSWNRKVELGELSIDVAWGLLLERIAPLAACPTCGQAPCPDPGWCASMKAADERVAQSRRSEQCKAGGADLEPHADNEGKSIVDLHPGCMKFWRSKHR